MSLAGAVFLDRDGTLITNRGYNNDPARICWYPQVYHCLRIMQKLGYRLVVVSNQSAVARGYCSCAAVESFHACLDQRLRKEGVQISAFYYSPYHPEGTVFPYNCAHPSRKPQPGMLLQAEKDLNLDLSRSWMVGDSPVDIGVGRNAGCRTVLVLSGLGTKTMAQVIRGEVQMPDAIVPHIGCLLNLLES